MRRSCVNPTDETDDEHPFVPRIFAPGFTSSCGRQFADPNVPVCGKKPEEKSVISLLIMIEVKSGVHQIVRRGVRIKSMMEAFTIPVRP
jgi:hypothetical protein